MTSRSKNFSRVASLRRIRPARSPEDELQIAERVEAVVRVVPGVDHWQRFAAHLDRDRLGRHRVEVQTQLRGPVPGWEREAPPPHVPVRVRVVAVAIDVDREHIVGRVPRPVAKPRRPPAVPHRDDAGVQMHPMRPPTSHGPAHEPEGPVKNNFTLLAADPSRLAALLVGRILPVCSPPRALQWPGAA